MDKGKDTMGESMKEPSSDRVDFEQFVEASLRAVTRALEARGREGFAPTSPHSTEESVDRGFSGATGPITIGIVMEPPTSEF